MYLHSYTAAREVAGDFLGLRRESTTRAEETLRAINDSIDRAAAASRLGSASLATPPLGLQDFSRKTKKET